MAKKSKNVFLKLDAGLDTYEPASAVTSSLRFTRLVNLEARRKGLLVTLGLEKVTDINEKFNSFGSYTSDANSSYLYALSDTGIYQWDSSLSTFTSTALETYTANADEPWGVVDYVDGLYYTRHGVDLRTVADASVTTVNSYEARYAINAQDHLLLANFNENGGGFKVRWSDLFDFTNFTPSVSNEADEYSVNSSYGEITGVTIQKNLVNIYTEKSILQATYIGFPQKYTISPLYTDIGNKYHYAVVQSKDVDYFIGEDNFYKLEGNVITPIGDAVWPFFTSSITNLAYGQEVRGVVDVDRDRVGWLFMRKYDATYPNGLRASKKYWVWYNYKEERWATEEADFISLYKPRKRLYFYAGYEDMDQTFASETRSFAGLWQATLFLYQGGLFGGEDESIYSVGSEYDGKVLHFETAEIHLDQPLTVKNLNRVTVHCDVSSTTTPADYLDGVVVSVGYRRNDARELTWVPMSNEAKYEVNTASFFVNPAEVPEAHSFAVRFTFSNTATTHITSITGLTLTFTVPNDDNDTV